MKPVFQRQVANVLAGQSCQVLQQILDMHQPREKFRAQWHTRSPASSTRAGKLFPRLVHIQNLLQLFGATGYARWKTLDMLGMGACGSVWLCENRSSGAKVAVKVLERGFNVENSQVIVTSKQSMSGVTPVLSIVTLFPMPHGQEVINHCRIRSHQVIECK